VLVPLLVRAAGDDYELIAGERRLRASAAAGRATVPVLVMDVADRDAAETTLIENLHRADLNVLEEAQGYALLMEQFGLTQEEVADRVSKPRPTVANALRLLALPVEVREYVASGLLSPGHAKLIAGIESATEQMAFARMTIKNHLSVRNLEKAILKARRAPRKPRAQRDDVPAAHMADISDRLHRHFGTSVLIASCKTLANGRKRPGIIQIEYYSSDDLTRILELLGLSER
jgi:ParB family chromosome partitioning protein